MATRRPNPTDKPEFSFPHGLRVYTRRSIRLNDADGHPYDSFLSADYLSGRTVAPLPSGLLAILDENDKTVGIVAIEDLSLVMALEVKTG